MELYHHRQFTKKYRKFTPKLQQKVDIAIQKFIQDPMNPRLRNHPLHGDMAGQRAFSVTSDLRIIFKQKENYQQVTLLDVGTHNQVY